ncbi:uncharacterized protein K02A2.6-like [Diorhabda carinulata]|uniref:uncharacterized protein K02A2.6-like n=1 Tax=Diorhabda carinulata TaxID=1163345 RepID=UPI0025A271C7|nr:uncharacterized protein K02A2.6-like [Diorhabda carinulata]
MIRERVIMGILDHGLREKLLQIDNLTLSKTEDLCRIHEQSRIQMADMDSTSSTSAVDTVDTGAQCNILPAKILRMVAPSALIKPQQIDLTAYGGARIDVKGSTELNCKIRGENCILKFLIVNAEGRPILGLKSSLNLNLIQTVNSMNYSNNLPLFSSKEDAINKYKTVFEGLGTFPGEPYKFTLKPDANPCVFPARRIPKSLLPEFQNLLNRLEKQGVISKQTEPTDWYIKREHFQIPSIDEILCDLNNKKYFSVLDLKDSFYQIKLDKETSKLTTFATPLGRYRILRLPFGINTAAEVFQRKNNIIFGGILGNKVFIDDLIISGTTEHEHDKILDKVLNTARINGITFNREKFQFKRKEVKILGFKVSEKGIEIDPGRIEAILKLEDPKNKKELLRFLAPLRNLTCSNVVWNWEKSHSESVQTLKNLLTSPPCLVHYNANEPLTIQCDASSEGMGACLLQKGQPIAFASRALTDCEKRYACIEREMSAILFAAERYNFYIYGKKINVHTDHKPLVDIFKKDINKISSRLQRMRLRLMKYQLEVSYLPGKQMFIADMLSRAFLKGPVKNDKENNFIVHNIDKKIPMSANKISEIVGETNNDTTLALVKKFIVQGWPKNNKSLSPELKNLFQIRSELSIENDLILFGDRVVIPKNLRILMLSKLHEGHLCINKCRARARESIFWPNISNDINNFILNCEVCLKFRNNNPKLPLLQHNIPERPWQEIAMDICL